MTSLKEHNKVAFIPFLVAGDPDLDSTGKALQRLDALGADVIEIGVPYSDPLADGPVIQNAATRALEKGTTLDAVLSMISTVSPTIEAPLVMFTYYNPIMRRGMELFMKQIKEAGASGLLVPDIPLKETRAVRDVCDKHGIELVLLATPTTPSGRMEAIAKASQGFVYLVSVTGVTGVKEQMESRVEGLVSALHGMTDKPVSHRLACIKLIAWIAEGNAGSEMSSYRDRRLYRSRH
ncbi:hypothetical protein CEUSTIGMA_g2236.t1 [Chlamydomonas eustigma]|uniref:tryptophan synthase n=1 Tax=Chlamydomonas eustigma TaxID=1157962 RepID=A0A250WVQ7_9CHLO|nr:hypothetical protein CEUSTIGMA_g2236.t1 [Chlamydomonas eustigma]|eukprot:GAX74789.1 hypothetical protein CEUSTIGMA_g2236.t1 [Chlamydomonas eustigma]